MAFTAELERTRTLADSDATLHNSQISERYRRLLNAEAEQFAAPTHTYQAPRASVLAPEAPAFTQAPTVEQAPQVTEFTPRMETTFAFQTMDMAAEAVATVITPAPVAPMQVAVYTPAAVEKAPEMQFAFSAMAKKVLMAVGAVVTVMVAVIGINSGIMRRNVRRIRDLEEREETLVMENQELQRRIEAATSEETIVQYALEQGMIKG